MTWLLVAVTMMNVAHRGLWVEARVPQNTVEAIRAAYEAGAKVVETDFNETACGEMICLHDKKALLTMVSRFDKEVKDLTPEDRATIDLGEKAKLPRPYRIPTLDEVLAVVPKDRVLQSEIKLYGPGYADKFDAAVKRAGLAETNITVSSFNLEALGDFHAKYPKYETIYLFSMRSRLDAAQMISRCKGAGVRVMCPSCAGCRKHGFSPAEAEKVRQAGLDFRVYGVNDPELLRYAVSLGATGFTCNTFKKAYEWAKDIPGLTLLPELEGPGFPRDPVVCEGIYPYHPQGVATDGTNIYWSFTTVLVKTDLRGKPLTRYDIKSGHMGDLCCHGGKVYVGINNGMNGEVRAGDAVWQFDGATLTLEKRYPTPQTVFCNNGLEWYDGSFWVVTNAPQEFPYNLLFEFTPDFRYKRTRIIATGQTLLGVQTILLAGDKMMLGCYGDIHTTYFPAAELRIKPGHSESSRVIPSAGASAEYTSEGMLVIDGRVWRVQGMHHHKKGESPQRWNARLVPCPELTKAAFGVMTNTMVSCTRKD